MFLKTYCFSNDLETAVRVYESCAKKYKATPQQLELLCRTLKNQQAELFERVVNATQVVHGKPGAYVAVIAALAEEGMRESLKQFLVVKRIILFALYNDFVVILCSFCRNRIQLLKKNI